MYWNKDITSCVSCVKSLVVIRIFVGKHIKKKYIHGRISRHAGIDTKMYNEQYYIVYELQ